MASRSPSSPRPHGCADPERRARCSQAPFAPIKGSATRKQRGSSGRWSAAPLPAERTTWWYQARFFLARSYVHLRRAREAQDVFLQIVRTPDDSYRWAAAGWICGEQRRVVDVFLPYDDPACRDASRDAVYVPSTGPLPSPRPAHPAAPQRLNREPVSAALQSASRDLEMCGDGRGGHVMINLVFGPNGDPTSVSLGAGEFRDGTPVAGTPVETCALAVARRIWLPAFTDDSFSTAYDYHLR